MTSTTTEVTGSRNAFRLAGIAQQAKKACDDARREKLANESARVRERLASMNVDQYWQQLEKIAEVEQMVRSRTSGLTLYRHRLLDQGVDCDIFHDIVTDEIEPWIRNRLCGGVNDHGFTAEHAGTEIMLVWHVQL